MSARSRVPRVCPTTCFCVSIRVAWNGASIRKRGSSVANHPKYRTSCESQGDSTRVRQARPCRPPKLTKSSGCIIDRSHRLHSHGLINYQVDRHRDVNYDRSKNLPRCSASKGSRYFRNEPTLLQNPCIERQRRGNYRAINQHRFHRTIYI